MIETELLNRLASKIDNEYNELDFSSGRFMCYNGEIIYKVYITENEIKNERLRISKVNRMLNLKINNSSIKIGLNLLCVNTDNYKF